MNRSELESRRQRDGGQGQGHPGRGREHAAPSRSASTASSSSRPRSIAAPTARCCSRRRRRRVDQRRDPLRRDHCGRRPRTARLSRSTSPSTGIIPGIKVDIGREAAGRLPGRDHHRGLDGLRERLVEYHKLGARFAKWRAVIDIGDGIPTAFAIEANAHALARYAALCQENDIVPIVEPEVLMDGAHSHRALRGSHRAGAAGRVRPAVRAPHPSRRHGAQAQHGDLGQEGAAAAPVAEEVAEATVRCLKRHVPPAVPGIAFLSGGQSPTEATLHLSLMNRLGAAALAADLQLRPGAAGHRAQGLGRRERPTSPPARRNSRGGRS